MLRYALGLAVGGMLCWQHGAFARPASRAPTSSLVVAAKGSNSSIAVAQSKKPAHQKSLQANQPIPPIPDKKVDDGAAAKSAETVPAAWKPEEISAAQARCAAILKDIDAVTVAQPPIRDGQCGAPAPIRLISVGKNP